MTAKLALRIIKRHRWKWFGVLVSMLPFRGVCLSCHVHCTQTAEDIDTISFANDSPMSLLDRVKSWLTSLPP